MKLYSKMQIGLAAVVVATLFMMGLQGIAAPPIVRPIAQTVSMPGRGDVADDICVWVNPTDERRSIIFGCNKSDRDTGGLYVFQLDGSRWNNERTWRKGINWFAAGKKINNVDLCRGFPAGSEMWDIVVAANRTDRSLDVFRVRVDVQGNFSRLESIGSIPIGEGFAEGSDDAPYGVAAALIGNRCMAFASDKEGRIAQYELLFNQDATSAGQITGRRFDDAGRPWQISKRGKEVEGIVVDRQHDVVYFASEKEGVFRYRLNNGLFDPESKIVVDTIGPRLKPDVEGLTLYARDDGTGYLIASSQGSSTFAVYQREFDSNQPNQPVNNFAIGAGEKIDPVSGTDGIQAISVTLGNKYREGIFIAHDEERESNYKFVPWSSINAVLKTKSE